ncbi:MAG: 5-oxoprolinase subunit PxpB [Dokdonella sp.]|uniref:5-oxoprolinase subunit PxpB n=1 Tax=Dokdonella sp. TaxID=2291710 RepID=UPI003F7EB9B7
MTPRRAQPACPDVEPLGDTALLLRFGDRIDAASNARVHAAAATLRAAALPGVVDVVPAYASLALHYSPGVWREGTLAPWRRFADAVRDALAVTSIVPAQPSREVDIPVCYGGEHGPDLDALAAALGLTADEVIARHSGGDYRVAMLGFAPGFPYLLGLDASLHAARRARPRTRVPRGSVAIGGAQTGIYPSELPGGWQLIGRTPLVLFDPQREPACVLAPGDVVRLRPITRAESDAIEREAAR